MVQLENFIKNSALLRLMSCVFLFVSLLAALGIGMVELLRGQPINQYVALFVGAGLGQAMSILGINYGVILQPAPAASADDAATVKLPVAKGGKNGTTS